MPIISKGTAIGKRAKISEAQKYMMLTVLGVSIVLGTTLALMSHFIQQISFNNDILGAQDESIRNYTTAIRSTGLCTKPKGNTYTDEELSKCNPSAIEISQVPDSLKYNIFNNLAANTDLDSVPKETDSDCVNPENKDGENYTYEELRANLNKATESGKEEDIAKATDLMQSCSALRIIPDALPSFRNEEALLASLNKLFIVSDWQPESLSPGGTSTNTNLNKGLNALSVNLRVEADSGTTMNVLHNIEHSIRDFNINSATIEWSDNNTLSLNANATAYYMSESTIEQGTQTINPEGDKK